jgi:hypothetical protein
MLDKLKTKIREQAKHQTESLMNMVKVSSTIREERLSICRECPEFQSKLEICRSCGCYIPAKTWIKQTSCPLKKWS